MRSIFAALEIIYGFIALLLIGAVMVVVFLFSFGFFLHFGPFIILFWMIRDAIRKVRRG